jgi:hypothetical protein
VAALADIALTWGNVLDIDLLVFRSSWAVGRVDQPVQPVTEPPARRWKAGNTPRPGQLRVPAVWAYLASDTLTNPLVTRPGHDAGAAGSGERVVIWLVQGMGGWP